MFWQKLYKSGLFLSFFLCVSIYLNAQVKISVIPSKINVEQNETFQLEFVIEGVQNVEQFTAPAFRNFELISGPNQTNGWTWVNGSLIEYVSYSVLLRSKLKGRLPIASAIIKIKGKVFTSTPLMIHVSDAAFPVTEDNEEERPDYYLFPGENVKEKIAKNLFLKATLDKQSCYIGEPILATFKLYTRLESQSKVVKRPSLNGFSVIDLEEPEAGNFSKEILNGRLYNTYLIRKVQLFPLQAGVVLIDPVVVENIVRMIKVTKQNNKETSTWLDAMMEKMKDAQLGNDILEERFVIKSDTLKVNVLELPEKNKPEMFTGAVGRFTLQANLQKNEIAVNENAILHIIIKGRGNIQMITTPIVNWPNHVDSFEAKMKEVIDKTTSPVSGTKTFDIPFTVSDTGIIEIPPIKFSFFDEKQTAYETLTTEPLTLKVHKALKRETSVQLHEKKDDGKKGIADWIWVAGTGSLLFLAAGLLFFGRKKKQTHEKDNPFITKEPVEEIKSKFSIAHYLQPAFSFQDELNQKHFYTLLMNGMQEFFQDRLHLTITGTNHKLIAETLKLKQYNDLSLKYQQIINNCEMIVFSGVEINHQKDQLLQSAIELMTEADHLI